MPAGLRNRMAIRTQEHDDVQEQDVQQVNRMAVGLRNGMATRTQKQSEQKEQEEAAGRMMSRTCN